MSEPTAPEQVMLLGRYRLETVVGTGSCTTLYRAVDEVLARRIAVKVLHAPEAMPRCADAAEAVQRFTSSVTAMGRLAHPRIASTYDVGVDDGTPYIVTEWVDGEAVADVVARTGPLTAAQSHTVAVQTAAALAYAHDHGVAHGQVDGYNVLLCADGNVKLTDFGVASAVAPDRPADSPPERRSLSGQDVRGAASLLYLCLTGRSVNGDEPLPPAPRKEGVLLSPQQVRAGVPRDLDLVVMRALGDSRRTGPPITNSAELTAALDALRPPEPVPPDHDHLDDHTVVVSKPAEPHRSRLLHLGAPALLGGIVVLAVLAAVIAGLRRPDSARTGNSGSTSAAPSTVASRSGAPTAPAASSSAAASRGSSPAAPTAPTTPTAAALPTVALPVVAARDFDPQGSPKTENPAAVPRAYDGDPNTFWGTDRYKTAAFGQLKSGVGVLFDLGQSVTVEKVAVTLPIPGTSVELRSSDSAGSQPGDFTVVASAADAGETVTLQPSQAQPARYWLVWVTRLPQVPGGFRARISEVAFTGRAPA